MSSSLIYESLLSLVKKTKKIQNRNRIIERTVGSAPSVEIYWTTAEVKLKGEAFKG